MPHCSFVFFFLFFYNPQKNMRVNNEAGFTLDSRLTLDHIWRMPQSQKCNVYKDGQGRAGSAEQVAIGQSGVRQCHRCLGAKEHDLYEPSGDLGRGNPLQNLWRLPPHHWEEVCRGAWTCWLANMKKKKQFFVDIKSECTLHL